MSGANDMEQARGYRAMKFSDYRRHKPTSYMQGVKFSLPDVADTNRQARLPRWRIASIVTLIFLSIAPAHGEERKPSASENLAMLIEIRGAIGPASSDFFERALKQAAKRQARLFILELDTPGGLDKSMRDMIQAVLASPIPVATYVAPSGARAASAGTFLLYASHIAAMAPATNLGAATPVDLFNPGQSAPNPGDGPNKDQGAAEKRADESAKQDSSSAMEHKVLNDSIAYIRGLAELRGRNADWAESAVREAASVPASVALKEHVIDIVASDVPDLLRQIDGCTVRMANGEITIKSAALAVERIESDWRTSLLQTIANPNVAYILMLIGIYGLLLEGFHPGAILPGVIGAISMLLALFAFEVLSVNFVGFALILLGVGFIVAESFVPSFGALGIGGIVGFIGGSILLMRSNAPEFRIATPLLAALGFVGGLVTFGIVAFAARTRCKPVVSGLDQLRREIGTAMRDFEAEGPVRVHGEIWNARTREPLRAGDRVRIIGVDGLQLKVERADE